MGFCTPLAILVLLSGAFSSGMAADCISNTQNFIQTTDIMNAINNIATNNFSPQLNDPLGLTATQTETLTFSGTTFCIRNDLLIESTHINLSDVVFGANDIVNQCCTGATCQGGQFTIKGDTGLTVILFVQPGGTSC